MSRRRATTRLGALETTASQTRRANARSFEVREATAEEIDDINESSSGRIDVETVDPPSPGPSLLGHHPDWWTQPQKTRNALISWCFVAAAVFFLHRYLDGKGDLIYVFIPLWMLETLMLQRTISKLYKHYRYGDGSDCPEERPFHSGRNILCVYYLVFTALFQALMYQHLQDGSISIVWAFMPLWMVLIVVLVQFFILLVQLHRKIIAIEDEEERRRSAQEPEADENTQPSPSDVTSDQRQGDGSHSECRQGERESSECREGEERELDGNITPTGHDATSRPDDEEETEF